MNQSQALYDEVIVSDQEVEELMKSLPKGSSCMMGDFSLVKYQDCWLPIGIFKTVVAFQRHFLSKQTDLIVASHPKTGTTWLKSLLFAIVNRKSQPNIKESSSLLTQNPHDLVFRLEHMIYGGFSYPRPKDLNELTSPRLFSTHYNCLHESIKASECKILYIGRNPLDTAVSQWHFFSKVMKKMKGEDFQPPNIQDFFEDFCDGRISHGPYFEHLVGYWEESLKRPNKVLFLKYEDLKNDPVTNIRKLAEFVNLPFSQTEESNGVIKEICDFCNINNLKDLQVNKSGAASWYVDKKDYFRKGKVGDWVNYFTPSMAERMNKLMDEKFGRTGLAFN